MEQNNHTDYLGRDKDAEIAALQAKCERYEKALEGIINTNHDNHEKVILKVKAIANEALSAGEGEVENAS